MKKDQSNLLKTKIKDLTPEDIAALEKPLGTSSRPFPMWGSQRVEHDGQSDLEQVLSVIADDTHPMKVYSDRSYKEVIALAYCDMPVPSMLPLFFDGLERRKPESTNRTQMMIGDPGHGKSFLGALQGRLRSKGSIEVFDCGGKNMNDLLFEMVLDFGAGDSLPKAIDKRLKAGTLEPMSLALLKDMPGVTPNANGGIESIDWAHAKKPGNDDVEKAFEILKKVSKIEGLDNAGGNALGMNSQYGPLISKFIAGEELVLDEYNKSREGSDNALQTVWQFFIGEIKECTVDNPLKNKDATSGPSEFTFRREDMKAGFFITLTGNKKEDGVTTRSLNKSVYSRLSPQTLPDPDVVDWQHRICQMMTGVPVSTLYDVFRDKADQDPDGFGNWLLSLRRTKAEMEGVPVPELQETLLSNWKNVVDSSEKLAKFYDKWSQMTDAEKIVSNNFADLIEEVDEEYSKKEGIDFRKIKQHLEEAIPIRPRMQSQDAPVLVTFEDWSRAPKLSEKVEENASLNFGTRLVEFLERMVYEKTGAVGKDKLYNKLRQAMETEGLRDIVLQEGARSQQKSVESLLNISAFADRDMTKQAAMARKVFCEHLRQIDPDLSKEDEDIVTVSRLRDALETVAKQETAKTNDLFVVNRHLETLSQTPLAAARIEDAAAYKVQNKELEVGLDDLVDHDDLMVTFGMPTVGKKNLAAVWDENIRPLAWGDQSSAAEGSGLGSTDAAVKDADEGMLITENRSTFGLAMTTLQVKHGEGEDERMVPVHILRNSNRDKTLIVGEKVSSKLLAAFREAGVTHVDRNDPNAKARVEAAVSELTRGTPESTQARLMEAFKYRNDVGHLADQSPTVADLLVDSQAAPLFPKVVMKGPRKAA